MVLSGRLQMLADMVTPGSVLADVGCDHGFLSIYLVQAGVCPRAVAMDVRKGPLAGAGKHIEEYGLGDYIETRLSDGLAECSVGEFGAVVCAGMGGRLMERILTEGREKLQGVRELILQPQSELGEFRAFLRRAGYVLVQEDAVFEEGIGPAQGGAGGPVRRAAPGGGPSSAAGVSAPEGSSSAAGGIVPWGGRFPAGGGSPGRNPQRTYRHRACV